MRVLISGGGTGGHIYPAIAIADAIKKKNETVDILFIGSEDKMEMEKVPKAGYAIEGIRISGLQRKLSVKNLSFPFKLIGSLIRCRKIIKRFKPDVAVGVGGYASGPALYVAAKMKIPTLIQEQNSYPGITNKLLANSAHHICVAYPGMENYFPSAKLAFTGNPVRQDLKELSSKREESFLHFGLTRNKKTILIVGGSLGARSLNEAMRENASKIRSLEDIQFIWQMGKFYESSFGTTETAKLENVKPLAFIDRMDLAYDIADLVICRAGALTISELAILQKPCILVPSPYVAEDHQTKNAMALVSKEAAILVKDKNVKDELIPKANEVLANDEWRNSLRENIKTFAKPNAAEEIADRVFKLAKHEN